VFDRYIGRLDGSVLGPLADREVVAGALERMFATDAGLPRTLVHGDPHLGNTYRERGGRPGFLDWQFVGIGPFVWDVSYYLTGALDPKDRRDSERDLLSAYRGRLRAFGVDAPSEDEIWLAHRRHLVHGFLSLLTPEESQPESFAVTMGTRFAIAANELDTVGALR
jgi:Ser/Thr protein kinase RdoA (MazF antagonist)